MPVDAKQPDQMTAEERMQEIAVIMARAINRKILQTIDKH